jgi:hypothetical protein
MGGRGPNEYGPPWSSFAQTTLCESTRLYVRMRCRWLYSSQSTEIRQHEGDSYGESD